jgi:hypothetical protein
VPIVLKFALAEPVSAVQFLAFLRSEDEDGRVGHGSALHSPLEKRTTDTLTAEGRIGGHEYQRCKIGGISIVKQAHCGKTNALQYLASPITSFSHRMASVMSSV